MFVILKTCIWSTIGNLLPHLIYPCGPTLSVIKSHISEVKPNVDLHVGTSQNITDGENLVLPSNIGSQNERAGLDLKKSAILLLTIYNGRTEVRVGDMICHCLGSKEKQKDSQVSIFNPSPLLSILDQCNNVLLLIMPLSLSQRVRP